MRDSFGVYPDGAHGPTAVFGQLEDAISWGLAKYGSDRFTVRYSPLTVFRGGTQWRAAC
jgi:hypothetical protein